MIAVRQGIRRSGPHHRPRAGVPVRIDTKRGKDSHVTVYYRDRKTVVKDRRKEIPPGLLSAMARQLGLASDHFR